MTQQPVDYERDGFCVVPQMLSAAECALLKDEAQRVIREHAKGKHTVFVGAAVASPRFRALADDPRIVAVLREIMPQGIAFLSDKIVFKSREQRFATPWHIDAFYWRGTRPKLSVWIALDDVSASSGALKVLPGSHLREWAARQSDGTHSNGEFTNVVEAKSWEAAAEVVCEVAAGGAIFFSDRLLHASTANVAGTDRYSLISTYHAPDDQAPAADEEFDRQFAARHVVFSATP